MAYSRILAERVRRYLSNLPEFKIEEKPMMGGLAFMVNGKMCINVSGENLMCRFDPAASGELANRDGYQPMIMRGRILDGYCYVDSKGTITEPELVFWLKLCLDYNKYAKASSKKDKGTAS